MAKQITMFEAKDGQRFDTMDEATEYERMLEALHFLEQNWTNSMFLPSCEGYFPEEWLVATYASVKHFVDNSSAIGADLVYKRKYSR